MTGQTFVPGDRVRLRPAGELGIFGSVRPQLYYWSRGGSTFHLPWTSDHDGYAAVGTGFVVGRVYASGSVSLTAPDGTVAEAHLSWLAAADEPAPGAAECTCPTAALMTAGCRCGAVTPYTTSW